MASESITYPIAFLGGLISFLSPCVLPLVPGYLAFMSGVGVEEIRVRANQRVILSRVFWASVSFVVGFSLVFVVLGASASTIGQVLNIWYAQISYIAGIIIIFFGLLMMGVIQMPLFIREYRFHKAFGRSGIVGSFITGLAFAFGWTPCVGPILAVILALAAVEQSVAHGATLLGVYALGLGIPFILSGLALNYFLEVFDAIKRHLRKIEIAGGVLLVLVGILVFTGQISALASKLAFFDPESIVAMSMKPMEKPIGGANTSQPGQRSSDKDNLFGEQDFTIPDLSGNDISLSDFSGQTVLLNFWAPWCGPCRAEMPGFEKVYKKYQDQGFVIFGVGVQTTPEDMRDFIREGGFTYPMGYDVDDHVSMRYLVRGIPTSILFDQKGRLVKRHVGFMDDTELEDLIRSVIK